eukprot:5414324-Amphidinium_carterae.1
MSFGGCTHWAAHGRQKKLTKFGLVMRDTSRTTPTHPTSEGTSHLKWHSSVKRLLATTCDRDQTAMFYKSV